LFRNCGFLPSPACFAPEVEGMKDPFKKMCVSVLVLAAFISGGPSRGQALQFGYLTPTDSLHIESWLAPAPAEDSMANAADVAAYLGSRALIGTARAEEAHADDVSGAEAVAARFSYIMGVTLDRKSAPTLMKMMNLVLNDADWLMRPVKKAVTNGGRRRPFVDFPSLAKCPLTNEALGASGSYPSGHGVAGWAWASVLAELAPGFADALFARGEAFGDSRVVCGFHYPSDVAAGRLVASALLARLHADPRFLSDLAQAKKEIAAVLAPAAGAKRTH
jgi:acid phosphatase (class A)